MKLIIDIDEDMYKACQRAVDNPKMTVDVVDVAIADGTPVLNEGDLISRRVIKDLISNKSIPIKFEEEKRGEWHNSSGVLLSDAYKIIDNAPTVEARKKWEDFENKADWIYLGETPSNPPLHRFKCGKCGYVMPLESKGDIMSFHFCLHCGYPMNTYISEEEKSYREWLNE